MRIILASTSPYRAKQLRDVGLRFTSMAPRFDEEEFKARSRHLSPRALARRLAYEKAMSVAHALPFSRDAVVIGADQLASMNGRILGKPGSARNARAMLRAMQGRSHELITGVCVIAVNRGKLTVQQSIDTIKIKLRPLTKAQILRYIARDKPFDCAGSYRFEKGGLALVEKMKLRDPSSLLGLPVVDLISMLSKIEKMETFL